MKRKTRTITVDDKKYVWWCDLGMGYAIIKISPFDDKTSVITIEFPYVSNKNSSETEYEYIEEFPEYIIMNKDNKEYCIKIVEPKMVSLILSYLSPENFISRKSINYNGFDLLSQMGFTVCDIKLGWCW